MPVGLRGLRNQELSLRQVSGGSPVGLRDSISGLSDDAALLAPVLAMYHGAETEQRLAQKMGWDTARLVGAVGIQATAGYAEYRSGMVKPVCRQDGRDGEEF